MTYYVGYQQKVFNHTKFNYICNTFTPVSGEAATMTLGAVDASDDFYDSSIQFLTSGGATAKVDHPQLGIVEAIYKFWWAEDAAAKVRGWYLADDVDGAYPMNDLVVPFGSSFCVDLADTEPDAFLTFSGQVSAEDNVIGFKHTKFNYIGNCTPTNIKFGDIDASDDFYDSSIQFLTSGGATAKVDHPQLGIVEAIYKFWWAEDAAAKVRGWYLADDVNGAYPMNDMDIPAGDAFCVDLADTEPEATVTVPSAL